VLANDAGQLNPNEHKGYLIDKQKNYKIFTGKKQLQLG